MKIKNSVAIVTGASTGIGLAIARALAAKGAHVVLAARSTKRLKELEREIAGSLAITADMTKPNDIRTLIEKTKEKFGRVDILINNAGQGLRAPIEKLNLDQYRAIMELNVFGVLVAMQAVIPIMRAQGGGSILNIGSLVSKNYFPTIGAYASTKYALNALTLTAREELKNDGIVVSVFHPKMTATDFGQRALGNPYESRSGGPGMTVDTPEAVAEQAVKQIESEEPESQM
jgi:short-subunit dehydrogenase